MTCRFSKVWRGDPGNLQLRKLQNSQISMDFEGSEAGIVKNQRNLKVLGVLAGRRRDSPGLNKCPAGLKYGGQRKVWTSRGLSPDPRDLCPVPTYYSKPYCIPTLVQDDLESLA